MKPNLKVNIAGIEMKNPLMTASGTYGFGDEYTDFYSPEILGGIITKTIRLNEHPGNRTPRIAESAAGILNSVGIPSKGLEHFVEHYAPMLRKLNVPVIQSILGSNYDEYLIITEKLSELGFLAGIELNLSCPNLEEGGLELGLDPEAIYRFVKAVKNITDIPIIPKLTPNTADVVELAQSAEAGGADCIAMINTVRAMAINIKTRKPVLANITGGLSGPAIKPIALAQIYRVYEAINIPIIGMGGASNYEDVIEFMLAGSSAVALGVINFIDPEAPVKILKDLEEYLTKNKIDDINTLVGGAH